MWNFKPTEENDFLIYNKNVINNNSNYIDDYQLIEPSNINELCNNIKTTTPLLFPRLHELYNIIPNWGSKADLARLLIIYYNGGIYCDVDCFIKKNLKNMIKIIM